MKKTLPLIAILITFLVLYGWANDITWLKSFFQPVGSMKVNTALGLLGLALATFFIDKKWSFVFAIISFLVGVLSLTQDYFHINIGIDEFFVRDTRTWVSRLAPGRPSPVTAMSLVLVSVGVFFRRFTESRRMQITSQLLIAFVWVLAFQSILSYLEGVTAVFGSEIFTQMVFHTSLTFALITTSLLVYGPDIGITSIIIRNTPSSRAIKYLMVFGIFFPPTIAWVKHAGETHELWTKDFGTVVVVILNIIFFTYVIYRAGINIIKAEEFHMKAQSDLKYSVQLRDDFLSLASHELKTPLTSIKLQTQMLHRQLHDSEAEEVTIEKMNKFLVTNARQIDRLTRLVDTMLDISRIDSKKILLQKSYFDIVSLVHDVGESLEPNFELNQCHYVFKATAPILGEWDRTRLEQIFLNLFSNAAKYGQGSDISVSFETGPNRVSIKISNGGKGIAPEDLERIFKRFERATDINETTGLGLGLYISRTLVELHNGTIEVESTSGKGATFTVNLPLI